MESDPKLTHQLGAFPQTASTPDVVNFGLGQPSPSLLPMGVIARATQRAVHADGDPLLLQYGAAAGYPAFREALGAFLTQQYGFPVQANQLAVTGGTSLALSMVSQVFAAPGRPVVCSDPTYFLAAGIFATQHLDIVGVPSDVHGLDVDALDDRLVAGLRPTLVYCIPSFHNPTGVNLAPERARRLVELAERYDFIVVADEPYPLLHFGDAPPCMMQFDEGRGRVLSLGTTSKILGPGLRLGWAHAEPQLITRFLQHGSLRSGGCTNPIVARIVHETISDESLGKNVEQLRGVLQRRARALVSSLEQDLGLTVEMPGGGYFLWLDLQEDHDTRRLLAWCREHARVAFTPGARCAISRDLDTCLRLSFAFYEPSELALGTRRLADAISRYRAK